MTFSEGFRTATTLAWLFSPPVLVVLVVFLIRAGRTGTSLRTRVGTPLFVLALANWVVFIILLFNAQTPYGEIFQTSVLTHTLLLLSVFGIGASLLLLNCRWPLLFANLLVFTLWVGIAYAPAHFLKTWSYGSATVDGNPSAASIFIAHPWDSEADAIVLVHIPAADDVFLSFGQESVHVAAKHRFIRVPGGVWSFASLREMVFDGPLPPQQLNEFRFRSSDGRVISVQF